MKPSEQTRRLFEKLGDTPRPVSKEPHQFTVKLETFDTDPDEIEMDPYDFPYLRAALISKACYKGEIAKDGTT